MLLQAKNALPTPYLPKRPGTVEQILLRYESTTDLENLARHFFVVLPLLLFLPPRPLLSPFFFLPENISDRVFLIDGRSNFLDLIHAPCDPQSFSPSSSLALLHHGCLSRVHAYAMIGND